MKLHQASEVPGGRCQGSGRCLYRAAISDSTYMMDRGTGNFQFGMNEEKTYRMA
ncbi:MAG: hypothetical protein ACLRIT_07710 [Blautia sp.]